jgi:hypothetical protein
VFIGGKQMTDPHYRLRHNDPIAHIGHRVISRNSLAIYNDGKKI